MHTHRALVFVALTAGCNAGINLFSLDDDIELGAQVHAEILADPDTFPLLTAGEYPDAYGHLRRIRDDVLAADAIEHRDDFEWKVFWIHDDDTLNAFAVPGGYLYVYTGIARYLQSEDHFAGVMGHEIAHADRRHSTQTMTQVYGVETLLAIVLGEDSNTAKQIASGLATLQFTRAHESDADAQSVAYLCDTSWAADGAAGFFAQLEADGGGTSLPAFLSTHPNPDDRIEAITAEAATLDCSTTESDAEWAEVVATLP